MAYRFLLALFPLAALSADNSCITLIGTEAHAVPGALTQCNSVDSYFSSCHRLPSTAQNGCYCNQKVFNAFYECQNEYERCFTGIFPYVQTSLSEWHKQCDTALTFSPTTPSTVSLTTTVKPVPLQACLSIESVCLTASSMLSSCVALSTASSISSCICQEKALSLASVCLYDSNTTCSMTSAEHSNIPNWTLCPAQAASFLSAHPQTSYSPAPSSLLPPLPSGSVTLPSHTTKSSTRKTSTATVASTTTGAASRTVAPMILRDAFSGFQQSLLLAVLAVFALMYLN